MARQYLMLILIVGGIYLLLDNATETGHKYINNFVTNIMPSSESTTISDRLKNALAGFLQ